MKKLSLIILLGFSFPFFVCAQQVKISNKQKQEINAVVEKYLQARDNKDEALLKSILTNNMDQLVSTGEWRRGKAVAIKGMMQSSKSNPGKRTIKVENIRFIHPECAIADARYEIQNADGSARKMWSTFIIANEKGTWKIAAIRNMLIPGK